MFEKEAEKIINGNEYRIVECEFYLYSSSHPDLFCHNNEMQLTTDQWYFHRAGTSLQSKYKGGTYKGLDITFGDSDSYGGILIRAVQSLETGQVIEGPCRCVNLILELCDKTSVGDLVSDISLNIRDQDLLYMKDKDDLQQVTVSSGPRVGLTFKRKGPEANDYIHANYRFAVAKLVKKEKWGFVVSAHLAGLSTDGLGSTKNKCKEYVGYYTEGQQLTDLDDTAKSLKTIKDKCKCYGFLHK